MKIIWHGHACFEIVSKEGSAVFDPYAKGSVRGFELPPICADAIISSHRHSDHCGAENVTLSGRAPNFSVRQIETWHDECMGEKRGKNLITVIEAEGLRVAHCGDLGHELSEAQLRELGQIDIMMIPVGGYYTVDALTAKAVAAAVSPTVVIPMHYRCGDKGLKSIAGCDEFTKLFPKDLVRRLDTNECTLCKPLTPSVTVFALPDKIADS